MVVRGDHGSRLQWKRVSGALLLAVSAGIHLDLYLTGYRKIPTIGWLFLLQVIVGFVLTLAALVTRSRLAAAASAALALSTLGAYLLAVWIGLFGFKEIRTRAGIAAGLIQVAAFATLALAAVTADPARHAAGPASPPPGCGPGLRARCRWWSAWSAASRWRLWPCSASPWSARPGHRWPRPTSGHPENR